MLAKTVHGPNHFFLPDDPMQLLMLDPEGMGWFVLHHAIDKEFLVDIKVDAVVKMTGLKDLPREMRDGMRGE